MDVRPEVFAGDTHALHRDGTTDLQCADHLGETAEKGSLFLALEAMDGAEQDIRPPRETVRKLDAGTCRLQPGRPRVGRIRVSTSQKPQEFPLAG